MIHQRKGGIHESTDYSWETFGWYRLTGLLSLQYLGAFKAQKIPPPAGFLFYISGTGEGFQRQVMKRGAGFLFLLFSFSVQGQKKINFAAVDRYVQQVPAVRPDSLATLLATPFTTDMEKARAVYSWICQNIRYNVNVYRPLRFRPPFVPEPIDTVTAWKSADEMVAQKVLRRRVAVCEGYARLFKTLCRYAGLEAVVINGYVRTNTDRSADRFRTNHTWNAVRIDSAWHLVDATWGAGYITYNDDFVQEQNDFYFLTSPAEMIRDHYPEDLQWTLLPQPPTLAEFRKMPFRSKSYIKYGIRAYTPAQGMLEADAGDTLLFSISLRDVARSKNTSSDPFADTAAFSLSPLSTFLKPENEMGETVFYRYVVDAATEWVHLLFNSDVILRYHITRRRSVASN